MTSRRALLSATFSALVLLITRLQAAARSQQAKESYVAGPIARVWTSITPATVKNRVEPTWPRVGGKIMGVVLVDVWIDEKGRVTCAKITRSIAVVDAAVIAAVQQWTFSPAMMGSTPVAVVQTIPVRYAGS
jgi:TonB family protein